MGTVRFFVLCTPLEENNPPYILAEVVRDGPLEQDRLLSIASAVAGERSRIATRAELMTDAIGRAALAKWGRLDDSSFERETVALDEAEPEETRVAHLRIVRDPELVRVRPEDVGGEDLDGGG